MKKLNNKGFAISTMLYGILAMIILILYLILSILNSGLYTKKQMVDDEEKYINKCANRQVALEKCYKTYNYTTPAVSCSEEYDAYTSCMGYEANSIYSASTATIKEAVLDYADVYSITEGNSTLVFDESKTGESRYVFVGANPKNYIRIGSKTGRIMSIEANGVVKVIMLDPVSSKIDTESGAGISPSSPNQTVEAYRWERSVAHNKLYQEYRKLEYTNKMVDYTFDIGLIQPDPTNAQSLLEIYNDAEKSKFSSVYGTITMEDYLKASANAHDNKYNCKMNTSYSKFKLTNLSDNSHKCNLENWINSLTGSDPTWTQTPANSLDKYYVIHGTKIETGDYNTAKNLYLVVCLSSKLTVNTSGDGSQANPYVISLK
ncbi:MAG: hypothetical protein IKQ35_04430 [Bacilli bacterium]|nr:hypothetical protein [Bacilli bacterium]